MRIPAESRAASYAAMQLSKSTFKKPGFKVEYVLVIPPKLASVCKHHGLIKEVMEILKPAMLLKDEEYKGNFMKN